MKCPYRPITITKTIPSIGMIKEEKKYEDCYGEECMAYSDIFLPVTKELVPRCGLVKGDLDV